MDGSRGGCGHQQEWRLELLLLLLLLLYLLLLLLSKAESEALHHPHHGPPAEQDREVGEPPNCF